MAQATLGKAKDVQGKALYVPRPGKLLEVRKVSEKETYFKIQMADGKELGHQPGQFVEVSVYGIGEAPISVSSSPTQKGYFELVVRKAGNVTAAMHAMKAGDTVGIRGPFGRGFDTEALKGKDLVFIGGGIGMVPLRSLINYVLDKRGDFGKVALLYGCKRPGELIFPEERTAWAARKDLDYKVTVDCCDANECWEGNVGVITTLIPKVEMNPATTYAVICGPPIMYKFVLLSLREKKLPDDHIIVSLERRMKCGVGKCGHCQMGKNYVCRDGPVFTYAEVKDLKGAI